MQEYTSPGEVPVREDENLTAGLWEAARTHPDRPAVAQREGDGFVEWSTRRFVDEVRAVAKGLMAVGVRPGERVAIYSTTRIEWTILDFAIWAAGAVTVPIYETSSKDQLAWIMSDAEVVVAVVESTELLETFEAAGELPACRQVYVIEDDGLGQLVRAGRTVGDTELDARAAQVRGADPATVVYTSGTTGRPKGCVISHHNFVWETEQVQEAAKEFFQAGKRTLLFLPLAHIFARAIEIACVRAGVLLGFSTGVPQLVEELRILRPDFILAVPRVFEKVYNGARQRAQADGKGAIFDRAARVAEAYSRGQERGRIPVGVRVQHAVFDRLVYAKLREALGGRSQYAVSGGAALGERLGHFFHGVGILVLEGYGLTETTAGACLARPSAFRIGTVGQPIPGASVRIAEDGEVLVRGGHVFQGYLHDDDATAEVLLEDGWLRTGDLGRLDGDGFLHITGRKKEILVTANGKNVAPALLEDRMRSHALVSQSMVVGDGRPFVAALICVDPEALETWAETNGKAARTAEELRDDPDLRRELQRAVDEANTSVSRAESIRTFRLLPQDFVVGEELSQKLSVKRHVVAEKYADVIEEIYGGTRG